MKAKMPCFPVDQYSQKLDPQEIEFLALFKNERQAGIIFIL
jgi:hypothetical protein